MYKEILSKDELADLLSPIPEDERDLREKESGGERIVTDHRDLAYQYLQETVRQMQKEISRLHSRVEALEKRQAGSAVRKEAAKKPADAPPPVSGTAEQGAGLSRSERHKARKSKWF